MIDSASGVRALVGVAVVSSVLAIAWRAPAPTVATGPVWPDLDAANIHRISIARAGQPQIDLERDVGAPIDDWHFAAMPTVRPSLAALHDFFTVAASARWRARVRVPAAPTVATIAIDRSSLVSIDAPLQGVGAAVWRRGNDEFLVDDWIAAALLRDVEQLQIPGPWKIVDGAPLQLSITGGLTPAHAMAVSLQGPPFIMGLGTPAQTFIRHDAIATLTFALDAIAADAVPPSLADLPARADPSTLVLDVDHAHVVVGAPCVMTVGRRLVTSAEAAWCVDTSRITNLVAFAESIATSPLPWLDSRPIVGDIKSIRIADKIELTVHGATWRIAALSSPSEPVDADGPAVEDLIAALHRVARVVAAQHGVVPSHPYLSVTTSSSPQPFSFEWDPVHHTLHRDLDPVLLGLDVGSAAAVATDLANYRDRTLWTNDENNIDRITIADGQGQPRIMQRGRVIGEWFSTDESRAAPSPGMTAIASLAASLRVEAFVAKARLANARRITLHFAAPPFSGAVPSTHVITIARNCVATVDDQAVRFDAPTCARLLK